MKRAFLMIGVVLLATASACAQRRGGDEAAPPSSPLAKNEKEKVILGILDRMVRSRQTYLSVPVQDGRMLRLLTESSGAKSVVEIGTSTGYSGLWFSLALLTTGGHLTTFEADPERATSARQHFKEAGVDKLVTIIEGDAHEQIKKLKDPIDVVFIDADKNGYMDYLNKLLPLVKPGGLILAHNIDMTPDYVKAVTSNPAFETIFYMEGGGLGITLKKR